jgi:glycosyltransferase involved in cell wall biosynthesis
MARSIPSVELSLVCPAFNEAMNLKPLLTEWDAALAATRREYEMILVDDASTDATSDVVRELLRMFPRLRVLCMRGQSGQSAALAAGFAAARGEWIVTSDADLQNDPADLPRLLELAGPFDMVCGWRRDRKDTWTKRLTSRLANARRRKLLDDGVHDSGCGLKVFRRVVAERILQFNGMHRFFPALAKIEGFTVTEVPVHHRARKHGKSKYWIFNRFRKPIEDLRGVAWYRARHIESAADEVAEIETQPLAQAG